MIDLVIQADVVCSLLQRINAIGSQSLSSAKVFLKSLFGMVAVQSVPCYVVGYSFKRLLICNCQIFVGNIQSLLSLPVCWVL